MRDEVVMKAIFTTQVFENYAWREDGSIGTGEDAYFKPKGGDEYVVRNVDKSQMLRILKERRRSKCQMITLRRLWSILCWSKMTI